MSLERKKSLIVGVPTEIKPGERRVGLTPASVSALFEQGNTILVQKGAGEGSGFPDRDYRRAGATITRTANEVWDMAHQVVKVKEPVGREVERIRRGEMGERPLFTYLHLAGNKALTEAFMEGGATGIAYETISVGENGRYRTPCLEPMSAIAGALAVHKGSQMLESTNGMGKSLQRVYGIDNDPGHVVIIGGGVVGSSAAKTALGLEANVTILEANEARRKDLAQDPQFRSARVLDSTPEALEESLQTADLAIGGIYVKGQKADRIVNANMLANMRPNSVFVDVAIDQGGMTELSRPTSHEDPVITLENGVKLYCVPNIPALWPVDATRALNARTRPYVLDLASKGLDALSNNDALARGLNIYQGNIVYDKVAEAHGFDYHPNPFLSN